MEQMIDIIKDNFSKYPEYTPGDIQKLGDYLMGKTDLSSVQGVVPTDKRNYLRYHSGKLLKEVSEACLKEAELLPRLGRFLLLIKNTSPVYYVMIYELMKDMSLEKLFIESGMGPEEIAFGVGAKDYNHDGKMAEMLDYLDINHPGVLEGYITKADRMQSLRPLVWFCAKHGIDVESDNPLGKKLAETVLYFAGCVAVYGEVEQEFRANLLDINPTLADLLEKGPILKEIKQNDLKRGWEEEKYFYSALCLSGFGLGKMNNIPAALCLANYLHFISMLEWILNEERRGITEDLGKQIGDLEEIVVKLGLHAAYFHAWAHNKRQYAPQIWTKALREIEMDAEILERAAECAEPVARTSIYRFLHDQGGPLSEDAAQTCIGILRSRFAVADDEIAGAKAEALIEYLLTGEGEVTALPWLNEYYTNMYGRFEAPAYDLDVSIWALAGVHPIAQRYTAYLAAHKATNHIKLFVEYLAGAYDWSGEQVARFLMDSGSHKHIIEVVASNRQVNEFTFESTIKSVFPICVAMNLDAAAEALKNAEAAAKLVILKEIYRTNPNYDADFLIGCLGDKSKKLRELAYDFLTVKPELVDKIRLLTDAKKKDVREAAERLLIIYEGEQEVQEGSGEDIINYCKKTLPKSWQSQIKWAFPAGLPAIRLCDVGQKAEEIIVQCYFYLMLSNKTMVMPPMAPRIRAVLLDEDLREAAGKIYDQWIADNAVSKQKAALFLYAVHGGDAEVITLQKQISEWAEVSRGAIAADAVRALVYSTSDLALMTMDSIARKFKNKMVRKAAQESFTNAATTLGVSAEVLGDRIIPTLAFDSQGTKSIDYGTRKFIAILLPSLEIELRDEHNKKIKSLPKPGVRDDAEVADKAKKEFAVLKKSLKAIVTTQAQRLELALSTGRRWEAKAWQNLFVQNPIMHTFAIGLVWGVYDGDILREAFRYMEDGTFTAVDDDEFDFSSIGAGEVGLVHPLDLDEAGIMAWRQQIEDYEISQPILQINRPVYAITEEEQEQYGLARVAGKKLILGALMGKLEKNNWYKGSVTDGGGFYSFYKELGDIGMLLYCSGMYIGGNMESIVVGEAAFYKAGTIERGSYVYDDIKKEDAYKLGEVSPRMFSELVYDLEVATASSTSFDENWANEYLMKVEFKQK